MVINRVKRRPATGIMVIWNGTNVDEVREVAGSRFITVFERFAVILGDDDVTKLYCLPGWSITRIDGDDDRVYMNSNPSLMYDVVS